MSNYVQKRNGTYYFRRVVPAELRPFFQGKREWTYSLLTKDKRTAERQAHTDAVKWDKEIEAAERKLADLRAAPIKPYQTPSPSNEGMTEYQLENMIWEGEETSRVEFEYEEREPDRRKILDALAAGDELGAINGLALQDILRDQRYEVEAAREQAKIARYYKQEAERRSGVTAPSNDTVT